MLRKKERIVIHPIFGKIRIEEKFCKVLDLKYFRELAFKSQLGTQTFSTEVLNAKHTRLMHSIGVMYLTSKLMEVCEEKFLKYFEIAQTDRETLLLAALGHDLGHVAFSHSLEDRNMKTHEQRTIEYFEECAGQINEIFGYDIVSKVIEIYKDNIDIKKQGKSFKMEDKLDILFVFKSLLIGSIDCDRMEYIVSDRFNVLGEKVDYREIFRYITIVLLNDSPTVGFEKDAVPLIEDMLLMRFNQYSSIYYSEDAILLQLAIGKYKDISGWGEEELVECSEYEIFSDLKKVIRNPEEFDSKKYRLAKIILEGSRENIMFKKFEDIKEYEYFLKRLEKCTSKKDVIKATTRKVNIYDPNKNKVYIKDNDGIIKDIMDVSIVIRDISINFGYVMVDLDPVYGLEENEINDIRALFLDNPVEIEKKFIFNKMEFKSKEDSCNIISSILKNIPGLEIKDLSEWNKIENHDLYFEPLTKLPKGVAMRHRVTGNEDYYYVKTPADDGTTITKRHENKYHCQSREEFLELVTEMFISKGYNIEKIKVTEGVKITTDRYKSLVQIHESLIEIACDFSVYEYGDKKKYGMMLECELKEGDDISLWYLSKHLKSNGFVETNESKQTRAKEALGIK